MKAPGVLLQGTFWLFLISAVLTSAHEPHLTKDNFINVLSAIETSHAMLLLTRKLIHDPSFTSGSIFATCRILKKPFLETTSKALLETLQDCLSWNHGVA